MKVPEAISVIEKSILSTSTKSANKDKIKLLRVLKELETKDFTIKQNLLLEEQLTLLLEGKDLNHQNLRERKDTFYSFLEDKLSPTYKGYWKAFGALIGSAFGFIGLTLAISSLEPYSNYIVVPLVSMAIGFMIGSILDLLLEKQGRTLSTWP